ncbi:M15 family metallopeptidase [Flavobacterium sp. ANB]|uniref:M15 family metallopeptidase n=1 Tax=unclassified Flavobacterium TaxID=196869 RepID=UPI0012B860F1|nr:MULTISPECIES: M15 family metallopeptidase [unclassified Flavobacterium]MBF4518341.1 M15 family metallopeptidase [Flavobacterium sp. ANB]MTD70962.1 peptidase M15 [Flavobacterium sp. LC2016-13]
MLHLKKSLFSFVFLFSILAANAQNEMYSSPVKQEIADTTFVNLKDYSKDFIYDMKYATDDNFLKAKVYDCAECFLRLKTIRALVAANNDFIKKGYKIKLYDCYRPLSIQKKMFEIVPNPVYVADPKKGSIHNRGGAVDISIVDAAGKEVDMGTPFDFFGIQAGHNYTKLSNEVLSNRKFLKKVMIKNGFNSFDSEWWHYNLKTGLKDKVANQKWNCE